MATITYDGQTITLEQGKTYTLKCAEKVFKTDIVLQLNEGESVGYGYKYRPDYLSSCVKQFTYNQTVKTIGDGYFGTTTFKCKGKKSDKNLVFHSFEMVELSGRYVMSDIVTSYHVLDYVSGHCDVWGLRLPIYFSVGTSFDNDVYCEFYIGDDINNDYPVFLIDADGNERYIGDKDVFNAGNGELTFHFNSPTKVPINFYQWYTRCATKS